MSDSELILFKLTNIEKKIDELSDKIDHFLGTESLTPNEERKVNKILKEMEKGNYSTFEELFG